MIAKTTPPPYFAVIFTSLVTEIDENYSETATWMVWLAQEQEGYFGHESAREGIGITVSYWKDLESIRRRKTHSDHLLAQRLGREKWYSKYKTRIALVEKD